MFELTFNTKGRSVIFDGKFLVENLSFGAEIVFSQV